MMPHPVSPCVARTRLFMTCAVRQCYACAPTGTEGWSHNLASSAEAIVKAEKVRMALTHPYGMCPACTRVQRCIQYTRMGFWCVFVCLCVFKIRLHGQQEHTSIRIRYFPQPWHQRVK